MDTTCSDYTRTWKDWVLHPARATVFVFANFAGRFRGPPSVTRREADRSLPSDGDVRNRWSRTYVSQCAGRVPAGHFARITMTHVAGRARDPL